MFCTMCTCNSHCNIGKFNISSHIEINMLPDNVYFSNKGFFLVKDSFLINFASMSPKHRATVGDPDLLDLVTFSGNNLHILIYRTSLNCVSPFYDDDYEGLIVLTNPAIEKEKYYTFCPTKCLLII